MSDREAFERERLISLIISVGMLRRDVATDVADAILREQGRSIHKAAGVIVGAGMARTAADSYAPGSMTRRALEKLADAMADVAVEVRDGEKP